VYKYNTPEMAMEAVGLNWFNFEFVRPDLITPEMAMEAVKEWGFNLKYVRPDLQTQEVIEAALKQDPGAKQFIKVRGVFKNALEEALGE
jgi:hypothetical protein